MSTDCSRQHTSQQTGQQKAALAYPDVWARNSRKVHSTKMSDYAPSLASCQEWQQDLVPFAFTHRLNIKYSRQCSNMNKIMVLCLSMTTRKAYTSKESLTPAAHRAIWQEAANARTKDPGPSKGSVTSCHVYSTRTSKVNGTRVKEQTSTAADVWSLPAKASNSQGVCP